MNSHHKALVGIAILPVLAVPAAALPQGPHYLTVLPAHPFVVQAQTGGPNDPDGQSGKPPPAPDGGGFGSPPVRDDTTAALAEKIRGIAGFCSFFPRTVEISCLADRYRSLAQELPRTGDYAPVRQVLEYGADRLDRIAAENGSNAPPKRFQVNPPGFAAPVVTAPLVEIPQSRQRAADAAARDVIDQMETVLLRSAENSRRRAVHFQEIAAAIDSNKVLLRS